MTLVHSKHAWSVSLDVHISPPLIQAFLAMSVEYDCQHVSTLDITECSDELVAHLAEMLMSVSLQSSHDCPGDMFCTESNVSGTCLNPGSIRIDFAGWRPVHTIAGDKSCGEHEGDMHVTHGIVQATVIYVVMCAEQEQPSLIQNNSKPILSDSSHGTNNLGTRGSMVKGKIERSSQTCFMTQPIDVSGELCGACVEPRDRKGITLIYTERCKIQCSYKGPEYYSTRWKLVQVWVSGTSLGKMMRP